MKNQLTPLHNFTPNFTCYYFSFIYIYTYLSEKIKYINLQFIDSSIMLFKEQLLNFVGNSKTLQENNSVMKIDQNKKHAPQGKFEIKSI